MKQFRFLPFVALAIAVAASAFTAKPVVTQQWHFKNGSQLTDARNYMAYEIASGSTGCGSGDLPCIIAPPHLGSNTDLQDLQAYLATFYQDEDVAADAVSSRN